jgi:hypothetical protein
MPLHGTVQELATVAEAIMFIEGYKESVGQHPIQRYEIRVRYNNGDSIEATFRDKADAVTILRTYKPVPFAEIKNKI